MSTKIYNAYWYKGTLDEFVNDANKIEEDYENVVEKFVQLIIPTYIKKYPEYAKADGNPDKGKLYSLISKQLDKQHPTYDDIFCFNASIVLYPIEGKLLLQIFGLDVAPFGRQLIIPTLNSLIESEKMVDYHYQNQSDPWYDYEELKGEERKAAEKDYEERERLWDIIFSKHWSASKAGFVKDLKMDAYRISEFIPKEIIKKDDEEKVEDVG